jgi:hypothetical protein
MSDTTSTTTSLVDDRGKTSVSSLDSTPKAPSVRDSLFSSCHSSETNIVLRAWRIRDSIGASSGIGFGTGEQPVSTPLTWIRTRNTCGSEPDIPSSRDIVPSGFRRKAARLRLAKIGEATDG